MPLNYDVIVRSEASIRPYIITTPLRFSASLSRPTGASVFLKCEHLQRSGSFKIRGALAAVAAIAGSKDARHGVVTSSAGNHGIGLSRAAARFSMRCAVVVPADAPERKRAAILDAGGELVVAKAAGYDAAQSWLFENLEAIGGTYVSGFDDDRVIAGNGGSTMLELMRQASSFDSIIVPTGGGGIAAGIGLVLKHNQADTRLIAVNAANSPAMLMSLRRGEPVLELAHEPTLADGLAGGVGSRAFGYCRHVVDEVRAVSEAEIVEGMRLLWQQENFVVEPAAATVVAALLQGGFDGQRVCAILTGRNVDWQTFARCVVRKR
ncbi:MAG: threonine ammonia-lyase [Phycisphaerae bacterium]